MQKTIVLTPFYGRPDWGHLECRKELEKTCAVMSVKDSPYIDMARSKLATEALIQAPEHDISMWIDHDMMFQTEDVRGLVWHLRNSDYDALGVMYSFRRPKCSVIGKAVNPRVTFYEDHTLVDAEFFGMGFTAVKKHVFEALKEQCPLAYCPTTQSRIHPFFSHLIEDGMYLGEDVSFCRRMKRAGFKLGFYTKPRVLHRGVYDYALEDAGTAVPNYQSLTIDFTTMPNANLEAAE